MSANKSGRRRVCKALEEDFPACLIADVAAPRVSRMKFDQQPYYVLTFLRENSRGELTVVAGE